MKKTYVTPAIIASDVVRATEKLIPKTIPECCTKISQVID